MDQKFSEALKNLTEKEKPISVRLQISPKAFSFFKEGGKGHITRMQNILEAYAKSQSSEE